jgi:hypothetical protein
MAEQSYHLLWTQTLAEAAKWRELLERKLAHEQQKLSRSAEWLAHRERQAAAKQFSKTHTQKNHL